MVQVIGLRPTRASKIFIDSARQAITSCLILLFASLSFASVETPKTKPEAKQETKEEPPQEILFNQQLFDFATVYAAQWAIYGITQSQIIREHGKLSNLIEYPFQPVYDNDGFDYNVLKHTLSGHFYYLFYRSRGYSRIQAFYGSFVSSLAFELAVESLTERPSLQDIYQTPVFGTVMGVGAESASRFLRASEGRLLRGVGYLLNPFALLPSPLNSVDLMPRWSPSSAGLVFVREF